MRRFKWIIIVLLLFEVFVVSMFFIVEGLTFNNSKISRTKNPYDQGFDESEWYKLYYGTHDWIAEAALDAVLADTESKSKWEGDNGNFWTNKRKICFLIGTEAPDSTDNPAAKSFTRLYLNNKKCTGMLVKAVAEFYESDTNSNHNMRPKALGSATFFNRAKKWTTKAKNYLEEGKCDAAAFYMGAILHLIADVASWPHTLKIGNKIYDSYAKQYLKKTVGSLDTLHKTYENAILKVTKDYLHRDSTFSYPKNFKVKSVRPSTAIKLVLFDTRWDYQITDNDLYTRPYPEYIKPGFYRADFIYNEYQWFTDNKQKNVNLWESEFKGRIQESLDIAIKYSAYAINFIAKAWSKGDNPKYCEDCENNRNLNQDQRSGRLGKLGVAVSVLVLLGLANSMVIPIMQILAQSIGMKA